MRGKNRFFAVLLVIVLLAAFAFPYVYSGIMKIIYPLKHEDTIKRYANEYDLDVYAVFGIIKAESNFVVDAQSHKGAMGLMQLTESTAWWIADKIGMDDFSLKDLSEPETNVRMGCWYLDYLLDAYDENLELALCAYNAGSGNVSKWLANEQYSDDGRNLDVIPFPETEQYVEKIKKYMKTYKEMYPEI